MPRAALAFGDTFQPRADSRRVADMKWRGSEAGRLEQFLAVLYMEHVTRAAWGASRRREKLADSEPDA